MTKAIDKLFVTLGMERRSALKGTVAAKTRKLRIEQLENRALLTAVADLVAYRPVNEYIDYTSHPVAESVEENPTRGPGIRANGDDDDRNLQPDFKDLSPISSADNDLVRLDIAGSGTSLSLGWTGKLAVWTTPTKSASVDNGANVNPAQSLWVEYTSLDHTSDTTTAMTLTSIDATTSTTATDTVVFHSFRSVVIAIGGNSQDPRNFGDPNLGTYTIAGNLYDQGYDVHLYAHNQVQSNGRGAAYDEVVSAVLNRNADNVAIFGYSWGGSATYELSAGLNANSALAPAGYKLQYTAYIDAIRHGWITAETRKPVGTAYHDNFYQRKEFFLKGNSVSGATNVNVTQTTWGKNLVHTTIDDSPTLQSELITKLMFRVTV